MTHQTQPAKPHTEATLRSMAQAAEDSGLLSLARHYSIAADRLAARAERAEKIAPPVIPVDAIQRHAACHTMGPSDKSFAAFFPAARKG